MRGRVFMLATEVPGQPVDPHTYGSGTRAARCSMSAASFPTDG